MRTGRFVRRGERRAALGDPAVDAARIVSLQSFVGEHEVDRPGLMAAGTASILPVTILFALLEPYLVSGLTKGALAD